MRISIFEKVEVFYPQCIKGRLFVKKNREEGGQTKPKYLRKCNTIDFSVTTKVEENLFVVCFVYLISEVSKKPFFQHNKRLTVGLFSMLS